MRPLPPRSFALGGGAAIVTTAGGYLGRIWADKFMARARADHEKELARLRADQEKDLARLRSDLEASNSDSIERLKAAIDLHKGKLAGAHADKIAVYRSVIELVIETTLFAELAKAGMARIDPDRWLRFETSRLRAYCLLGMLAPQHVMDAYTALTDYFNDAAEGKQPYDFRRVRELGIHLINQVRSDLAIDPTAIEYRGTR